MKNIHKLKKSIDDFFFNIDLNPQFIVFFRISVGLLVGLHFLSMWPDFQRLYGKYGIVPWDLQGFFIGDGILTLPKIINFFEGYGIEEPVTLLGFKTLYLLLALFVAVGFLTRPSAILLLVMQVSFIKGAWLYTYGVDVFTSMSLFYVIIFPSGRHNSVDKFLFKRKPGETLMPFRRMFQLHVSIAYFFSGFAKSLGNNWWNGEAIWKATHMPYTTNNDFSFNSMWFANHSGLVVIMGWSIIIIEMLYPVFVWIPKIRKLWLSLTIMMHLGIALVLGLYFFSAIMIIWNLTAFYFYAPVEIRSQEKIETEKEPIPVPEVGMI